MYWRFGSGNNRRLHFQTNADHSARILDTFKTVNDILFGDNINHFAFRRQCDNFSRLDYPVNVILTDLAVLVLNSYNTVTGLQADMIAGYADIDLGNLDANHLLRMIYGAFNRLHGLVDIYDRTFAYSF
ncbi:hypothetical protein D3C84_890940 [compost metagenome]